MDNNLIVIVGPTGIGKTDTSIKIAQALNTEIISCDSRQIYKETRIGTAVPSHDQLKKVPHHMVQVRSIKDYYNASMFEYDVLEILGSIFKTNNLAIMTGGSGFYIDAVCRGIDEFPTTPPELRNEIHVKFKNEGIEYLQEEVKKLDPDYYRRVDLNNPKRLMKAIEVSRITGQPYSGFLKGSAKNRPFKTIKIGLNTDREFLYSRINERVDLMINEGLIDEARRLYHLKGINALNTVGYKELFEYFEGHIDLDRAIELIKRNSRRYARRQITWFNRYDDVKWFEPNNTEDILNYIQKKTAQ
jgi:tRNA dimethylallyltransferase